MALLLGPPGSGKTTLLLALAAKLGNDLKVRKLKLGLNKVVNSNSLILFFTKTSVFWGGDIQWARN